MALSMSLAEMRSFIRESLDSDDEELPNSLLDRFIVNGSAKIEGFSRTWSFRAVEYTFTTIANQREYNLDTYAGLTAPRPVADITAIQGPSYELRPADHRKMRQMFPANSDSAGSPSWFTRLGRSLYLWPKPSGTITYTVIGYRQPTDWVGLNSAPDFPDDLHELIAWWALNRAHVFLDDPELADFYRSEFDRELLIRSRQYLSGNDAQPLVVNGGTRYDAGWPLLPRGRYDWEG